MSIFKSHFGVSGHTGKVCDPRRAGAADPHHRQCELVRCSRSGAACDLRHYSSLPVPPVTDGTTRKMTNLE